MYIIFNLIRIYRFIYCSHHHPTYTLNNLPKTLIRLCKQWKVNSLREQQQKKGAKMTKKIIIKIIWIASQRSDDGEFVKRLRYSKCRQSHGD